MATPTPKLKVTIDTDSANVERILTALGQVESNADTVALTGHDVAVRVMSRYQPTTNTLSRPEPDVGARRIRLVAGATVSARGRRVAAAPADELGRYVHRPVLAPPASPGGYAGAAGSGRGR
jgi:hypothetical protein